MMLALAFSVALTLYAAARWVFSWAGYDTTGQMPRATWSRDLGRLVIDASELSDRLWRLPMVFGAYGVVGATMSVYGIAGVPTIAAALVFVLMLLLIRWHARRTGTPMLAFGDLLLVWQINSSLRSGATWPTLPS